MVFIVSDDFLAAVFPIVLMKMEKMGNLGIPVRYNNNLTVQYKTGLGGALYIAKSSLFTIVAASRHVNAVRVCILTFENISCSEI